MCVDSTEAGARVLAFLADACQRRSALGVGDALWSASDGGVAMVSSHTRAHGYVVGLSALGVLAARRWHTGVRVLRLKWRWCLRHQSAVGEWISDVALGTTAYNDVVDDVTLCSCATLAWARVSALVAVTVLVPWTICIQDTLWFTSTVRVPEVFITANAYRDAILVAAICVGSTR